MVKLGNSFKKAAQQQKLVPHLDKAIGQGDFVWDYTYHPKEGDQAWHPSGDCTPSMRDLYLKARGELVEKPITTSLYKAFAVGHFWHQYLQWTLIHQLEFCDEQAVERPGSKSWGDGPFQEVRGSADVAPVVIPVHGEFLLDVKTMNGWDFNKSGPPLWSVDKWECQTNIYMDFFDLDRAIILGVQKDSPHEFKEFEFRRNEPLIEALYLKWRLVSECLAQDLEPPESETIELPLMGPAG